MKGMILAAGFGTRFRPATFELPKPLIPLCNQPLIGYAIENLLAAGVREIVINLHHLPAALEQWVRKEFSSRADFEFSFEAEILGTGGALRKVRSTLQPAGEFFLLNGDTVQRPPLSALAENRRRNNTIASLVLRHPPAADRFTRVWLENERITGFGSGHGTALMFAGAHVLSSDIFDLIPDRDFSGITEDVYLPLVAATPGALSAEVDDGFWFDIGTPLRYRNASGALLELICDGRAATPAGSRVSGDSLLDESATVDGTVVRSTLCSGAAVGTQASVRDSDLWWRGTIGARSTITGSVIGSAVAIPAGSVIDNALLCNVVEGMSYPDEIVCRDGFAWVAVDPSRPVTVELS